MNRIRMYVLLSLGILVSVLMIIVLYNGRDLMQKYNVYQMDNFVIVEDSENPEAFYFKEWIYYSDFIKDAYLCTIELGKARSEKEAYLYVDLGALGGWWADPFNNLQRDKEVSNEYVSDELISELKKYVHLDLGIPLVQMTDEVEINELTDSEVKRIAPEIFEEVYDDEAVIQWYQEVDFDNDNKMDIVVHNQLGMGNGGFTETYFYRQLENGLYGRTYQLNSSNRATRFLQYDGKAYFMVISVLDYNVSECEYDYYNCELYYFQNGCPQEVVRLTPQDNQINMTVRKRFVNDFINISEGVL
ncbi:MAG: hypothetical protein K2M91_05380 [Lachnospiraceae bacterium]|nr:hypothetical protein [Lachnospiraceae bacterium]